MPKKKKVPDGFVKIDPRNDIYWVVNPSIETVEEKHKSKPIVKLTWGFDWDNNKILMTKEMATKLRDDLTEILKLI